MRIGVVGLGNMGAAIAANILRAGHDVTVWNRTPAKADPLVALGATLAETPADAAAGDAVITMLADDAAVEAAVLGTKGLLAAAARPLHVSMSTIGVALVDRLAAAHTEAGSAFVAAPVFGRPAAAQAAKLFIVAAGEASALAQAIPIFAAIGQKHFTVGERPSAANAVKLVGNFLLLAAIQGLGEAAALASAHDVAPAALVEVLTGSLFPAPAYETYGRIIAEARYRPAGFPAPLALKDMGLLGDAAQATGVPMPLHALLEDRLQATIAREGEDIDWSGLAKLVIDDAGTANKETA
jgi:3-hydroxyisobutyrate dehydrogenase-like beta-hydroxyacid dehydrogenase